MIEYKNSWKPTFLMFLLTIGMLFMPSTFNPKIYPNTERVPVRIITTDNSLIKVTGMIRQGEQICTVEVEKGVYKGQQTEAVNLLMGNLENDKIFEVGDRALAVLDYSHSGIEFVNLVDHYRLDLIAYVALAFVLVLVAFAGAIGLRSLLSFVFTILTIWKVLIPLFLMGYNPIWVGLMITIGLTMGIISLVYGYDRRSFAAILGSSLGTLLTAVLSIVLVNAFKIHGAVMPFSESLLYSGFSNLNLTEIFTASIFIACSGAMMDVAVDITASVDEVIKVAPETTRFEAIRSGVNVGRAVMGTMTTTLLLAYSGGFISLLMVFMAQGTPLINILNLKYVSSEILHTLVGSLGRVTVAPFTALTSGYLLTRKQ
jgi:uncharacterized membrane protein